jgi:hypothetical protein
LNKEAWYYNLDGELSHYGIKGQKWGEKNGPPYPLDASDHSSTEKKAGTKGWTKEAKQENKKKSITNSDSQNSKNQYKKLKDDIKKTGKEYRKLNNQRNSAFAAWRKDYDTLDEQTEKAARNFYLARRELQYAKAKTDLNKAPTEKSKRRLKLEETYKKQGMTDEEAAAYAARREKIEKYVAIAGATALTGVLAYAAYKNYKMSADGFIKSGDNWYRVSINDSTKLNDFAYIADAKDAGKYVGFYGGGQLKGMEGTQDIYQKTVKAVSDIKVASEKNAAKIFGETLKNNPDFAKALKNNGYMYDMKGDIDAVVNGKNPLKLYKRFNTYVMALKKDDESVSPFVNAMKKAGYDAMYDYNDRWQSGYNSKSATIVFDKASTVVDNVRQVPVSEMKSENTKETVKLIARMAPKIAAEATAWYVAYKKVPQATEDISQRQKDREIVQEYKREHPNSKLSYNEILKNYNK